MKERMEVSAHGVAFVKGWEYFVPFIYDDFVPPRHVNGKLEYVEYTGGQVHGTLTEGYGHTKAAHGRGKWALGSRLTEEEAAQILADDMEPVVDFLNRVIKVDVTQGQFDAMASITFNCGEGTIGKSSLLRKLNAGDYAGARRCFDLYVRSKGKVMNGLQRRRDAEQLLWDEGGEVAVASLPQEPVHHTAEVDEPTTKGMAKSTEGWTSIAQTAGGTVEAGRQGFDASDAADKIIDAKDKAEQLGVEPIKLFDHASATLSILVHQPMFWVAVAVAVGGVYLWFRRRWRMQMQGEM